MTVGCPEEESSDLLDTTLFVSDSFAEFNCSILANIDASSGASSGNCSKERGSVSTKNK